MNNANDLILIPGLVCDQAMWQPQIDALGDEVRVHVTEEHARQDSIESTAGAILGAAPERFAVAGLSMGGYVALEIYRQAPERIAGLGLLNSAADSDDPDKREKRREMATEARAGRFEQTVAKIIDGFFHEPTPKQEKIAWDMARRADAEVFARQQLANAERRDQTALLPSIGCPTLVIGSIEDRLIRIEKSRDMAVAIPGASLLELERCAHLSTLYAPDLVSAAMQDWLAAAQSTG